ncbi:M14 family metallopeptidase [candidate division KSB1 bacterium]
MKKKPKTILVFFFILLFISFKPGITSEPDEKDVSKNPAADFEFRYHNYAESTEILKELVRDHPDLAKLYSIGKSVTGKREIWCIEIGNRKTGALEDKPAAYFDANQHASEVTGGEVTLFLAYYLLKNYNSDSRIKELLDTRAVYIIQRADPDGAEAYMTDKVDWDFENVQGARDSDNDGKIGEDGPEDIDGDGRILQIRIKDHEGSWKCHPEDPRLMIRREDGETEGEFYRVISEGIDNDGDGSINEDAPVTGFISNRNYPAFWSSPNGRFRGRGDYPLQEHNARILADFIISRSNIAVLESYHTTSGIHLRPYAARPDDAFPPQDLQDYCALLGKGTEITTYPVASVYNDFTTIRPGIPADEQPGVRHGVFIDWTYQHLGIFSVTTELWTLEPFINETGWGDIPRDKYLFAIPGRYNRPDVQIKVLKWLDDHRGDSRLNGQGFINWKIFRHPDLGNVEIGGFTKYWLRNPPPGVFLEKVVKDQAEFAVLRALSTPVVKIKDITVKKDDENGWWLIEACASNTGYLDTSTEQARIARISEPDKFIIDLPEDAQTDDEKIVDFEFMRGTRGSSFESLYYAFWRVKAEDNTKILITIKSEKGGTEKREIVLH